MSLLTALLAFVPALAAKRERASEDVVDLQIGLAQAQEARDDWRRQLYAATTALEGFRRQNEELQGMVRARDQVIDRLVAQSARLAQAPLPMVFHDTPVQAPQVMNSQRADYQNQQQNALALAQQTLGAQQALGVQALVMAGEMLQSVDATRELWGFCNCVPARSDVLRRRFPNVFRVGGDA